MYRKLVAIVVGLLVQAVFLPAYAQRVYVSATAEDSVGSRLAFAIKEGIRRSAGLSLADREDDGLIGVRIVTLDPDEDRGNRTIYSVVWTVKTLHDTPVTMYLTNSVGICGSNRVAACADNLVADTDARATQVRGWIRDVLDRSKR